MQRMLMILVALVLVLSGCEESKNKETMTGGHLTVLVSEQLEGLVQRLATDFMQSYPEARIDVIPTTTREAIGGMLSDSIKLICVDRQLNTEEIHVVQEAKIEYVETRFAVDAYGVIVHPSNKLKQIDTTTLAMIVENPGTTWEKVPGSGKLSRIDLALTNRNSGVYEMLVTKIFKLQAPLIPAAVFQRESEVVAYVAKNPRALGIVSFSTIIDSLADVKVLELSSLDPALTGTYVKLHQGNIARNVYPYVRSLYMYATAPGATLSTGFAAYIARNRGQIVIQKHGLVPATVPIRIVQLKSE
jgi:phosphate transport system substrate-binding protein